MPDYLPTQTLAGSAERRHFVVSPEGVMVKIDRVERLKVNVRWTLADGSEQTHRLDQPVLVYEERLTEEETVALRRAELDRAVALFNETLPSYRAGTAQAAFEAYAAKNGLAYALEWQAENALEGLAMERHYARLTTVLDEAGLTVETVDLLARWVETLERFIRTWSPCRSTSPMARLEHECQLSAAQKILDRGYSVQRVLHAAREAGVL